MIILKKLNTMRKGIRNRGLLGFFKYFLFESDNDFVGHYVELRGNRVKIENLLISVNSPAILRRNKSQIVQGRYERPERDAIKKYLDTSKPVIELGGSIGVVACMTNRLLQEPHQHIVVEAHPHMAATLEKNRANNGCHFEIIQKAVAYQSETVTFYPMGFSSSVMHVSDQEIRVPAITLKQIAQKNSWKIFSLICDIEGAEVEMIAHETELLKNHVSMIIIELHPNIVGEDTIQTTLSQLDMLGFKKISQEESVFVFVNNSIVM